MNVLVQWVGLADLRAAGLRNDRLADSAEGTSRGPTKTLLANRRFDRIVLLTNADVNEAEQFADWLGESAVEVREVGLADPTDYGGIYRGVVEVLRDLVAETPGLRLHLHLSPGTPAMTAVWVLLGKTLFPATFHGTHGDDAWEVDVPFKLTFDALPELLRESDTRIRRLSEESPAEVSGFEAVIGDSPAIREAVGRARRVAIRSVGVLLKGESGTGKELFAHAIHAASPRRDRNFVALNCAALPADLLEAELFGREKGAFTGADKAAGGAFERADGGTLFLDEVGECAPQLQAKLLRVLQPLSDGPAIRHVRRVGGQEERRVNVRIIAATNRNLLERGDGDLFREDLYYRLASFVVHVPPLRARDGDAVRIADALLARINQDFAADDPRHVSKVLDPAARSFVAGYAWPGNVRQLLNVLTQAAVLAEGQTLHVADLEEGVSERASGFPRVPDLGNGFDVNEYLHDLEKTLFAEALRRAGGVQSGAADLLGLSKQTFGNRLKKHQPGADG